MKTGTLMELSSWIPVVAGLIAVGVIVTGLNWLRRPRPTERPAPVAALTLLFRDNRLIDANNEIWPLLSDMDDSRSWDDVRDRLLPLVPNLPATLSPCNSPAPEAGVYLRIDIKGQTSRVTLIPENGDPALWLRDRQNAVALDQLKPAFVHAPNPMWSVDAEGQVIWGNDAFATIAADHGGLSKFARQVSTDLGEEGLRCSRRIKLERPGQVRWLEVVTKKTEASTLFFATGVDAVVRAEEAQRNFVQTLSKTFANLTTGLAIFDRDRRLALFNPALVDLSSVSAEFLSNRPALFEFFDKLREKQIMPEPKNYDHWRERMAKLVAAASDDRFRETWNLAGGQTLDVTGRPYPDGAIAFLFNDITAEVSLTRGFRTELETMQSLIDAMDDAVAVFNQRGILTVCNLAYRTLWNVDPDSCMVESTILDATQEWKSAFHPTPVWPELRDFVVSSTERASWDSELRSRDGREVICRVDPICFGSTLVRFSYKSRSKAKHADKDELQIVSG